MTEAELRAHLESLLTSRIRAVVPEVVDGRRSYLVRFKSGEVRAKLNFRFAGETVAHAERETRISALRARLPDGAATPALDRAIQRAKAEDGPKTILITGTASSTSVDWYGTEMSLRALQGMADQFRAGVDVTPRHHGWFSPLEWNDVMGRTVMASIERSDVVAPANVGETGFTLAITGECYEDDEMTAELTKRLARGQPIGLSIGGWFTEVRYIYSDDGDLERIIIEAVELDHVAVVRNPANPDCMDLEVMRSIAASALRGRSVASDDAAEPNPAGERGKKHDMDSCSADCSSAECACSCHGERSAASPHEEAASNSGTPSQAVLVDSQHESRNAGDESTAPTSSEVNMTPEQLEAILQRSLASLNDRLAALEAQRAAPAPTGTAPAEAARAVSDEDPIVADLRSKLERERIARERAEADTAANTAALAAMASQPARAGRGTPTLSSNPDYAATELDALIGRAKAGGNGRATPVLAAVASRAKPALAANFRARGAEGQKLRQACNEGQELLRALCMAAEQDGLIGNIESGWN